MFICLIAVLSLLYRGRIAMNIPSLERQALYDLYVSTNGDDWIYQDGDQDHQIHGKD